MDKLYKVKATTDEWDEVISVQMTVRLSDNTGKQKEVSAVSVLGSADKAETLSMTVSQIEEKYINAIKSKNTEKDIPIIINSLSDISYYVF